MSALLWFHDNDTRPVKKSDSRERQLEGSACTDGIEAIPGERDAYQCVAHGQRMYYQQRPTIESPLREHAQAVADVVNSGPSYADMMQRPTLAEYVAEREKPLMDEVARRAAGWSEATKRAVHLAAHGIDEWEQNADNAMQDLLGSNAVIKQVGWYCAGGHQTESSKGLGMVNVKAPSLRFEDPCKYAVPVYALVNIVSADAPNYDAVAAMLEKQVVVALQNDKVLHAVLKGIGRYENKPTQILLDVPVDGGGADRQFVQWGDIKHIEPDLGPTAP